MGKEKRTEKNKNHSKNVDQTEYCRIFIIGRLKKMHLELDQLINYYKQTKYELYE